MTKIKDTEGRKTAYLIRNLAGKVVATEVEHLEAAEAPDRRGRNVAGKGVVGEGENAELG